MTAASFATRPIEVLLVGGSAVDDVVRAALAEGPFRLRQCADLQGLSEPQRNDPVDLVLLTLPAASGTSPRQIWLDVPVLAIADPADPDAELRALEEGALDWVTFDELTPRTLTRAIRYVLDRHRLETELQRMAHVDPLTGLHNRRYLMKQLDAAVGAARRHGHPLTVCVCDIDRFKEVNDAHGHLAGDDVLRAFATLVSDELRREDEVARFGGDEFCLMFPHVTAEEATSAIERIRDTLARNPILLPDGSALALTATYGLATFDPAFHATGQGLFEAADQALYDGKQSGRDRVATAPSAVLP